MAEIEEIQQEDVSTGQATAPASAIADALWNDAPPPAAAESVATAVVTEETPVVAEKPAEDRIVDANEYLKQTLGYESWDSAKAEIEELRKLKDASKEHEFKDETSKTVYNYVVNGELDKLYEHLGTQRKLATAETLPADQAIKLHLELTNGHYTPADVQDVFEEKYGLPKKPVQALDETDPEFAEREQAYTETVERVQRRITRDAIEAKQALTALKTNLVLPDIKKQEEDKGPTAEEIASKKAYSDSFAQAAKAGISDFKGFSATVTYRDGDKDVSLPVAYAASPEETGAVQAQLQVFVASDFNANALFASRWLNEDGKTINAEKVIEDLTLLQTKDRLLSKIANEAANQRLEAYLKEKKNIKVGEVPRGSFVPDVKSEQESVGDFLWR